MKLFRNILKWLLYVLLIPVSYIVLALILTYIPIEEADPEAKRVKYVFLSSNGVHLSIILPVKNLSSELKEGLMFGPDINYLSVGWGEENFYLNTPTWKDLTFTNAFRASFMKNSTLLHLTRYRRVRASWTKVNLSEEEFQKLTAYITNAFKMNEEGDKIILAGRGYQKNDDFYRANGRYSLFYTCNTWVNSAFKESGMKACLWTPVDFGLLRMYKK